MPINSIRRESSSIQPLFFAASPNMTNHQRPTVFSLVLAGLFFVLPNGNRATGQDSFDNYADPAPSAICPNCDHQLPRLDLPGWRGQPWRAKAIGGCRCGRSHGSTHHNFDSHWAAPFSVLIDHGCKGCRTPRSADTTNPRARDGLDRLASLRVLPPVRSDNGYSGTDCDPYGYLGVSRGGVVAYGVPDFAPDEPAIDPQVLPAPGVEPDDTVWPSQSSATPPTIVGESSFRR